MTNLTTSSLIFCLSLVPFWFLIVKCTHLDHYSHFHHSIKMEQFQKMVTSKGYLIPQLLEIGGS
jgi:hypothetical protein